MPPSGLIAEDVVFSTDLSGLPNGVYTLLPIAAARKGSNEWGAWMKFKKAPRFILEVQNDSISVREKPSQEAASNSWLNQNSKLLCDQANPTPCVLLSENSMPCLSTDR